MRKNLSAYRFGCAIHFYYTLKMEGLSSKIFKKLLTFCGTYIIMLLYHRKRGDKMSPRIGRPKSETPLTIEVKARIDKETNEKLVKYCKDNNVTRTDVVREGIKKVIEKK